MAMNMLRNESGNYFSAVTVSDPNRTRLSTATEWDIYYDESSGSWSQLYSFLAEFASLLHHVASLTLINGLSDFAQSVPRDIKLPQRIIGVINRRQFIQYVITQMPLRIQSCFMHHN